MDNCKSYFGIEVLEDLENHSSKINKDGTEYIVDRMGLTWPAGEYEEIEEDAFTHWISRWEIK